MRDDGLGVALIALARAAISRELGLPLPEVKPHPRLNDPGAVFVTLTQHGRLRGCIGSLEAWRPLAQDVQQNAVAAAFRDPRFEPLTAGEFPRTCVEVSLLSTPEPMHFSSEDDALAQLVPGHDGVIFECDGRRSTFLPQVWEQLPEPREFMANLKQKAGLPAGFWQPDVSLSRYRVEKWKEKEERE